MSTDLRAKIADGRLDDGAAGILVAIMAVPEEDRLDALAFAIRAALDAGIVTYQPPSPPQPQDQP